METEIDLVELVERVRLDLKVLQNQLEPSEQLPLRVEGIELEVSVEARRGVDGKVVLLAVTGAAASASTHRHLIRLRLQPAPADGGAVKVSRPDW